jgi:hypothetical protein
MLENLETKTAHHPLAGELKQVDPQILKEEFENQGKEIQDGHHRQSPGISPKDVVINSDLRQIGSNKLTDRTHHEDTQGEQHQAKVGAEVSEQTAHEAQIVRLALGLIV